MSSRNKNKKRANSAGPVFSEAAALAVPEACEWLSPHLSRGAVAKLRILGVLKPSMGQNCEDLDHQK